MFKKCGDQDVLFDETFVAMVDEYFKDSNVKTIYIDVKQEPFKTILKKTEKLFAENAILWHGYYFIQEGKEYLFDQDSLKPVPEGFERTLIDEFSEYNNVDIVFRAFIYDENDFLNLETIDDLEKLIKKYRKIIKKNYKSMMRDLCDSASVWAERA